VSGQVVRDRTHSGARAGFLAALAGVALVATGCGSHAGDGTKVGLAAGGNGATTTTAATAAAGRPPAPSPLSRRCGAVAVEAAEQGRTRVIVAEPTTAPAGAATTTPTTDPDPNCRPVVTTSTTSATDHVPVGGEIVVPFTKAEMNGPPRPLGLTGEARIRRLDAGGRRWSTSVAVKGATANTAHGFGIVTVSSDGGMGGVFLHSICRFTTSAAGTGGCSGDLDLDDYHAGQQRVFDNISLLWSGADSGYATGKFPGR
jgi:hypothetical protein